MRRGLLLFTSEMVHIIIRDEWSLKKATCRGDER